MSKLKIILFFIAIAFAPKAFCQKITMYKTFGGVVYMLNDSAEINTNHVRMLLHPNEQAYTEFKKAKTWGMVSSAMGFTGAAVMAAPLVTLAFGEQPNATFWELTGGGAALIVGSIFVNRIYKARALYAIDLYNDSLPQKTSRLKPQLRFYSYGTGASIVIKF